jgi:hypothetical protein
LLQISRNIIYTHHYFKITVVIRPATWLYFKCIVLLFNALIKKHIYYCITNLIFLIFW